MNRGPNVEYPEFLYGVELSLNCFSFPSPNAYLFKGVGSNPHSACGSDKLRKHSGILWEQSVNFARIYRSIVQLLRRSAWPRHTKS
jgi:hypothetical protein